MSKLKYLNLLVTACGTTVIVIGSIVGVGGAIKGEKNWIAGMSLILAGTALQAASLHRFFKQQVDEEFNSYLLPPPIPNTCKGCRNYHGVKYKGILLVCAIHPHGVEEDTCSDHEN